MFVGSHSREDAAYRQALQDVTALVEVLDYFTDAQWCEHIPEELRNRVLDAAAIVQYHTQPNKAK